MSSPAQDARLDDLAARQARLTTRIEALMAERDLLQQESSGGVSSHSRRTRHSQPPHDSQLPSRDESEGLRGEDLPQEEDSQSRRRSGEQTRRQRGRDPVIHVTRIPFPRTSALNRLSYSAQSSSLSRPAPRHHPATEQHRHQPRDRRQHRRENSEQQSVSRPPPHPERGAERHQSVFRRLSHGDSKIPDHSVEEMEKRLRAELKLEMAEMMKTNGYSGNSSARSLIKDSESPFALSIQTCSVPKRFKPPSLESYDGAGDPLDHWQLYTAVMDLQDVPEAIVCRTFITTLKGAARMWYNNLSPRSVHSLSELGTKFLGHFLGTRARSKSSSHLFTIKQEAEESLKDYSHRFNKESLTINNLNDGVAVAAFLEGVTSTFCLVELSRQPPRTMSELLEEVNK